MTTAAGVQYPAAAQRLNLPFIIFASALGTVFEWHDFYLYATLALRCREAMRP